MFSVDGLLVLVWELFEVCWCYGVLFLVDEVYGLGVCGGGCGLFYELGLVGVFDVVMIIMLFKVLGS